MTDAAPSPLRNSMWPLSFVYRCVTGVRNWCFDNGLIRTHELGRPVVSVGNLTVGGTGKTPLVAWLVQAALDLGRRPGVLARGYGRAPGAALNDEGQLLAARFPGVAQVQDPDRVAGGRRLVEECDVDLVILDDGMQHRRLHRDRELVCLDAKRPFAGGAVLPAGDLREGARAGLGRADAIVLTRVDRIGGSDELSERARQIRAFARRELPVFGCRHRPSALLRLGSDVPVSEAAVELDRLNGQRVVLASAIARPLPFRETVERLGAEVVDVCEWRDHHRYGEADIQELKRRATAADAVIVTTEKDAVKLAAFEIEALVLRIDLEWVGAEPTPEEVGLA